MNNALQQIHDKLDRILAAVEKKKRPTKEQIHIASEYIKEHEWFWEAYPHRNGQKLGRRESLAAFSRYVKKDEFNKLRTAVRVYNLSKEVKEGFAVDPVRFFKNRKWSWRDWLEPAKPQPSESAALTDEQRAKQRFGEGWCCKKCGSDDLRVTSSYSTGKITALCRSCNIDNTFGG